ncbi:MAG TPA: DUF488 family protein [Polyangiaceae bacterium]|nr:DUF488 family protein [Polyangiaceae bacterium]
MIDRIQLKRAYESPATTDGYRVLVERLWPRGVRKETLELDAWLKDLAPSDALRRWFNHDPERWAEFSLRYRAELREEPAASAVRELAARTRRGTVSLIFAAKDEQHNSALVLRGVLQRSRAR